MEGIRTRHLPATDGSWHGADGTGSAASTELLERRPPADAQSRLDASPAAAPGLLPQSSLPGFARARPSARRSMLLGGASLLVCIFSFVFQTVITRRVQESYVQPYFILWVSHSFWVIILPLHTAYEKLKRQPRSLAALKQETLVASAKLILQRKRSALVAEHTPDQASFASDAYQPVLSLDPDDSRSRSAGGSDDHVIDDGGLTEPSGNAGDGRNGKGEQGSALGLAASRPGWVLGRMAILAALLATLLNSSAYLWYVAVGFTSMSKVTAIYNTSCFFAYLFSVLMLKERVQVIKCIAVAVSIIGVVFMALVDTGADVRELPEAQRLARRNTELFGDLLSLICACGIGLYQVVYKKYAVPNDFHSLYHVNFMTTLLGICTLAVFWIPIPALHATGVERFHWPSARQLAYISANALFGVAYNCCFMIALALTSPLFAAVGVMLTIPAMAVVDMAFQGHVLAWSVFAGGGAILAGFATLTYAEYCDSVRKAVPTSDTELTPSRSSAALTQHT